MKIGDGVTEILYTDRAAYSIVEIKSDRKIVVQKDTATLKEDFQPEIVPGGFAGHCTNNREQRYNYTPNPEGPQVVLTLRKSGKWLPMGQSDSPRSKSWKIGIRSEFYDYNF